MAKVFLQWMANIQKKYNILGEALQFAHKCPCYDMQEAAQMDGILNVYIRYQLDLDPRMIYAYCSFQKSARLISECQQTVQIRSFDCYFYRQSPTIAIWEKKARKKNPTTKRAITVQSQDILDAQWKI